MKAIVYEKYGSTTFLKLKEVEKPVPKKGEVLVKIHAASVNSWDWDLVIGKPYIVRLGGLTKPAYPILGADIAGTVEALGPETLRLKEGDAVFADLSNLNWGGFAEYVCVPERVLSLKPAQMSFEYAAALPQAGVLAWQGLNKYGALQKGQKILINGAGGGVGTLGIQLAKFFGAEVTAVDHKDKFDIMRSSGADHVINYTEEDFTQNGQQYDLIMDVVARRSLKEYRRSLAPEGGLVVVGGDMGLIFRLMLLEPMVSRFRKQRFGILIHKPNRKDVDYLGGLFEAERLVPIIDDIFPLLEVPKAIQKIGDGQVKGKVIINTMA